MAIAALETAPPVTSTTTSKKRGSLGGVILWLVLTFLIIAPVASFLILGVSPRVFQQGPQWFTLTYVRQAFSSYFGRGIFNSLWVSTFVAIISVSLATALAWFIHRTNVGGRRFWAVAMWLLLMMPTWMMTLGWSDLLQPFGAAQALGVNTHWIYGEFFGPLGIVVVLTSAAFPFAYFIVTAGLQGLGPEYVDAARIHGAGPVRSLQTILPIIAPALLSALAISFAETMSDFGVAFTLGYHSHFPMATYVLFNAISNFPANFSVAAVIATVLIISTIPPIVLQSHVMRKRSYAVFSGRTRAPRRRELARGPRAWATVAVAGVFFVALGVPILGAVIGSLVKNLGIDSPKGVHFTLTYYAQIFKPSIQGDSLGA